jgi:1-acyl-sn-glycerol-3-phosphate acyltransferase
MRTAFAYFALIVFTPLFGGIALLAALFGLPDGPGSVFDRALRWWARGLLWASGVEVVVHGDENRRAESQIFVANHVSRFDVLALASQLRHIKFVAKAELARIPVFGRGARAVGTLYIQRDKRQSSFETYRQAAAQIGDGASVVVFAEGTRSPSYAVRPFKKGPFVLAISAKAPVVPTVVYGGLHVQPKGTMRVRSGRIDVHFLEPVPVAGLTYEDRHRLASTVRERIAVVLRDSYGIESPPWEPRPHQGS